jgi:hypothetical protein
VNKRLGVQYETRVRERERKRRQESQERRGRGHVIQWKREGKREKEKKKVFSSSFKKAEQKTKLEKLRCASHRLGSKLLPLTLLGTSLLLLLPRPNGKKSGWMCVCTRASSYPVALSLSSLLLQTQKVHTKGFKLPASLIDPFSFPSLSLYVCSSFLLHYLFCL